MKQIHNGDHLEYEIRNAHTPPEERIDWPLPSFDARDWAKAFCKIARTKGLEIDEGWMVSWFANALMRGYDEAGKLTTAAREEIERLTRDLKIQKAVNELAYIPHRNLVESRDRALAQLETATAVLEQLRAEKRYLAGIGSRVDR